MIPVIDSLENALKSIDRSQPAINALCERMLTSLQQRFSYLLDSDVYQVASLLDPAIKLSFTDHESACASKFFVFSSTEVKAKLRLLLPQETCTDASAVVVSSPPESKKPKLLDFSSATTYASISNHFYFNRIVRIWNSLPLIDLDSPFSSIKKQIYSIYWDYFITSYSLDNSCSWYRVCLCSFHST